MATKVSKPRDMRRRLVTPEGVDLGVVIGDTGQRIGAFLLDMLVMLAAMIVLSLLAGFGAASGQGGEMIAVVWLLGFFVIRNFYFIAMELRPRAATLGKRWMGLRVVARDGGRLTADELARLDDTLAGSPEHAMVCLHHHPILMGSRWLDTVGLADPDEFWRIIDSHSHVRAVVWGHVHQVYDGRRNDVRLFATPSTGAQFLPGSDRYAVDTRPPAYRHFNLHPGGRIDTAVHWIESLPMSRSVAG